MVDAIGGNTGSARALIQAALQRHADAVARATGAVESSETGAPARTEFTSSLVDGIKEVDAQVRRADSLVEGLVTGKVQDFHEVAAALKESELTFKFSLEVRNKFIDAYREVMRMTV